MKISKKCLLAIMAMAMSMGEVFSATKVYIDGRYNSDRIEVLSKSESLGSVTIDGSTKFSEENRKALINLVQRRAERLFLIFTWNYTNEMLSFLKKLLVKDGAHVKIHMSFAEKTDPVKRTSIFNRRISIEKALTAFLKKNNKKIKLIQLALEGEMNDDQCQAIANSLKGYNSIYLEGSDSNMVGFDRQTNAIKLQQKLKDSGISAKVINSNGTQEFAEGEWTKIEDPDTLAEVEYQNLPMDPLALPSPQSSSLQHMRR